jgi:hypothetical protein
MKVVNYNDYASHKRLDDSFGDRWVYVGRADSASGFRQSALGNPYTVEEHGRGDAIDLYRRWLWQRINEGDRKTLSALGQLNDDSVLVCWCKPKACHGEQIAAAWQWLKENDPDKLNVGPVHG